MLNWLTKTKQEPKTLGQIGEELAQLEYKKRGLKILAANFFNRKGRRLGEIDFIAKNKEQIIFVEVKTRSEIKGKFGSAAEAVNIFKQIKILKAVKVFLLNNQKFVQLKPQIDVCVVIIPGSSELQLVETDPAKYVAPGGLDKIPHSVTILVNAIEDWG